jgi:hypothetical protein
MDIHGYFIMTSEGHASLDCPSPLLMQGLYAAPSHSVCTMTTRLDPTCSCASWSSRLRSFIVPLMASAC